MRDSIAATRERQLLRFRNESTNVNGKMKAPQIRRHCKMTSDAESLLKNAMEDLGLSARAHDKVLRVGRTIADLDNSEQINSYHISEAINFRTLDRSYWQQ